MTPQWRDQTALEAFPFRPGASRRFSFGELFDRDFVDFHAVCRGRVWLSSLEIHSGGFSGRFLSSHGEELLFSGEGFSGGAMDLESSRGGVRGVVVVGESDLFLGMPAGTHRFPDLALEIVPTLVSPPPPGVSSIVLGSESVFGTVSVSGVSGVAMECSFEGGASEIRIHADGDFLQDCAERPAILSINGVMPGASGGISISPSSFPVPSSDSVSRQVFRINPSPNGIRISIVDPDV
jgi:hypothetical protein